VTVSSILPPGCELITRVSGVATLSPGELTFCVLARSETNEPGRRVAAGIGLARPKDPTHYGYISERHAFGMSEGQMRDYVEDFTIADRSNPSITSTTNRARCCSGSHSSSDGGSRNPVARSNCRKLLIKPAQPANQFRQHIWCVNDPLSPTGC
jgi:hypothetical protein